ncbi:MAG: zinc-binding dehydrogenase [Nakamurella sp.]
MRALVKYARGQGNVAVQDVPEPALAPGSILIDVAAVAICGTDRMAIEGGHDKTIPRILGHEVSGTIRAFAPDVTSSLQVGDRVTVETDAYLCGVCEYCRKEEYNRCPFRLGIGTTADGGLAEQLAMPALAVHKLPDNVSFAAGALTEPLAVSVHGVIEQSPSIAGQVVVVIGTGAIGMLCAQVARVAGATVVLVGRSRHSKQLALAKSLGIDHVIDSETRDLTEFVKSLTDGYGAHSVYECSGGDGVLAELPLMLRRGGRIVLLAFFRNPPSIDFHQVLDYELEVVGSRGKRASSYRTALRLMGEGRIDLEAIIGARLPLDQWEQGIELVSKGVKVVIEVNTGRPGNN